MGNDYHPPGNAVVSEQFVKEVYASLIENRSAWEKTLLVITFDEFVGTFDHIVPGWDGTPHSAAPPWGSEPPPQLSIKPPFDFKRFGGRVPTILVSPWVAKSVVFRSQTDVPYDHTSLIATTLQWLGLEAQLPSFGMRAQQAPTFDGVLTLDQPRTDEHALLFLDTNRSTGDLVQFGDAMVLRNQNGRYLSTASKLLKTPIGSSLATDDVLGFAADLDMAAFYPTLGGALMAPLTLLSWSADPPAQVDDGAQILLVTYELGVGANNVLGAWNDSWDCYHYDLYLEGEYAGSQTWTVQQVDRPGQPLRYGDKLRLINKGKGLALAHDWRRSTGVG